MGGLATRAWQVPPFSVYAATETGGIAADCHHHGMHLFDDLLVTEVVDRLPAGSARADRRPTAGHGAVQPHDPPHPVRADRPHPARGRTVSLPSAVPAGRRIEGRTDDLLVLPTPDGGTVPVHPAVFHQVLEPLEVGGWQVRQNEAELRVLIADPGPGFDPTATEHALRAILTRTGARAPAIHVSVVDSIPAGRAGKRPLIIAQPGPPHSRQC